MKTKRKFRVGSRVQFIRSKEKKKEIHVVDGTLSADVFRVRISDREPWYPESYFKKAEINK